MDDHLLLFLVLFLFLSVGGVAMLWIGLSGIRKARVQAERECVRASGTVVELAKHMSLVRGRPLIVWHPVVEFQADGKTHRLECRTGYWVDQFKVGEGVDVLYAADDPGHYHLEKYFEQHISADRVTVIAGVVWLVVSAVVAYINCW